MWDRAVFPTLWRRSRGVCTCLCCSSQSTRQAQVRTSVRSHLTGALFPTLPEPHLVLGGHRVNSVKELIQIQINHFYSKLVLPWWLSCSSSLYSCTNSYVTEREELVGRRGRSCDLWAARVQCTPEDFMSAVGESPAEAHPLKLLCVWFPLKLVLWTYLTFQRSCKMFLIVYKINIIMLARIGERSHFNPEGQGSFTHTFGDPNLYSIVTPKKKKKNWRTVA